MSAAASWLVAADESGEGHVERVEGEVEPPRSGTPSPWRSPRQCSGPLFTRPRRLCVVIGPFIGWKTCGSGSTNGGITGLKGLLFADLVVVGVAEVPREIVHVAEDVAARARRLAVAAGELRVVEERPSLDHVRGLGVVERRASASRCSRREVDDRDRVVEARQHVEPIVRASDESRAARRRRARCGCRARREGVVLERGGVEDADLAGAEGRDVERRAIARHDHPDRRREALGLDARGRRAHRRSRCACSGGAATRLRRRAR